MVDWSSLCRVLYEQRELRQGCALIAPSSPLALALSLLEESLTVPMLVELMKKHEPFVQAACLGAIQNLSSVSTFQRQLLERGVLEALDSSKDVDGGALGAQCAAVLYNFSFEEKSITKMMELGGIFLVTHLSYSNVIKVGQILRASHGARLLC